MGWRGYLLQKLSKEYSVQKSIIISGIIWGIWHAPIIAMGHNYGTGYVGAPWLGIFAHDSILYSFGFIFIIFSNKN